MDERTGGQIDRRNKKKDSLNMSQTSVLFVPVPSPVNAEGDVRKSIQHKTYKTNRSKETVDICIDELI